MIEFDRHPEIYIGMVVDTYDDYKSNWNIRFKIPGVLDESHGFIEMNTGDKATTDPEKDTYPIATPLVDPQHEVKKNDLVFVIKPFNIQNENFFYLPMYEGAQCRMNFRNNYIDMTPDGIINITSVNGHSAEDKKQEDAVNNICLDSNTKSITINNGSVNTLTFNSSGTIDIDNGGVNKINLNKSGTITITDSSSGNTIVMNSSGTITINSKTSIDITVPKMNVKGDIVVNGEITATGDITAAKGSTNISLMKHIHNGNLGFYTTVPISS